MKKRCEICEKLYTEYTIRPELCPECNDMIDETNLEFEERETENDQ